MRFSDGVIIQQDCWLDIANNEATNVLIDIGKGSNIGRRCVISAHNRIIIGEKVLIAPNVYIADCQHEYRDIDKFVIDQGINSGNNKIIIGDGTWIGMNSCILGNVSIGRNCVIGANSFVNKDIPDYSVAVGSPAKVVKMYDNLDKEWKTIKTNSDIEEILNRRDEIKYRVEINQLKSLQVEVASICNLKCPQCFNNIQGHKSGILKKSIWEEKIRPILPQLMYLAKKMKVSQVIAYHDIIYSKKLEKESLYYNQKESDSMFKKAKEIANEQEIEYFCPGTFNNPIKYSYNENKLYCSYPYMHLWVYSDGRIGPCCMDFPNRIVLGDLKKSTIEEIWNDKPILKLRKSLNENLSEKCIYCAQHAKIDLTNKKYLIKHNER